MTLANPMIRFASWERVSTEDRQDPESSRAWQYARGKALVQPHGGVIVVEFFDIDKTRAIPPQRRPEASKLLAALADPNRGFDAVVVGEPQRAFYGNQFGNTYPLFTHYGVPLWIPEVGGPIDPHNEAHDMIMSTFGSLSKGERNRIKIRVHAAMSAQAQTQGRYLGGRPPYGYTLLDTGPHPNPTKAADGKRLHALGIDEPAAAVVARIFAEFLAGAGIYAIAEGLTRDAIPCPSAHDPGRNRHRSGIAWSKSAIRVILTNPRYTGRQVWNRQRKDEVLLDIHDVALGHTTKMRWNNKQQWIFSEQITHPVIINAETFQQTQDVLAARGRGPTQHKPHDRSRAYTFAGTLYCGLCQRRMQGHWLRDAPYYRCRFPNEYALANNIHHPRNVYLRQDDFEADTNSWLATAFAPHRLPDTIDQIMAGQHAELDTTAATAATARIAEANLKMTRYRAALDAGGDPEEIGKWIADTKAQRLQAEATLRHATTKPTLTRQQIQNFIQDCADIATQLRDANPNDLAQAYRKLGLRLTYHPERNLVHAAACPPPATVGKWFVSEGGLEPPRPCRALAPQASASAIPPLGQWARPTRAAMVKG
jgi:site-specific DNA recombinase